MKKISAPQGAIKPLLPIVVGVILLVIVVGLASGVLKFKGSVSVREGQPSSSPPEQPSEQLEAPPVTKTYENTGLGMSLEYPEGWSVKENPAAGVVVAFGSPKESLNDTFVDNVNVSVSDLSSQPQLTLDEITDLWRKQTEGDLSAGTFRLLEIKPATLAGAEAKRLVYTYSLQGREIKGLVVIAQKGDKAYVITYSAEKTSYDKFVSAANTLVSSFQVK